MLASDKAAEFKPRDYIMGRHAIPPSVLAKAQRAFGFGDDVSIATGTTGRLDINIQDDAHFLVEAVQIVSSVQTRSADLADVQITDTTTGQSWSNAAVPLRDLAGRGDSPKYLSHPNLLNPSSNVAVQITNNTGGTAQFYVVLHGRKIKNLVKEEEILMRRRLWFQYVLSVTSLAAGVNDKKYSVRIQNESDFLLHKMLSVELITAVIGGTAGTESTEVMMNLRDTSSDQSLFSKKIAARLVLGQLTGEQFNNSASWGNGGAFPLRKPWLVKRNGLIEGAFDNRANAATGDFRITLEGIRVFDAK